MPQCKPHLADVHRHGSGESREGFLRLDMNENPDGLPADFVREVLGRVTPEFLASYPEYAPLKEALARAEGIAPECLCLSGGSDGAIKLLFEAFVRPGDSVLLTDPTFAMYPVYADLFQAQTRRVAYDETLRFPLESFLAQIDETVRMGVLVNPNNPTGRAFTPQEVERTVAALARVDALAVMDEAYFQYHGQTALPLLARYPNLVVLRTFSKLCGMAALRLGYVAASAEVAHALRTIRSSFEVNALGVLFAQELLRRPDILDEEMRLFRQGKDLLLETLGKAGADVIPGEANFVLVRCPGGAKAAQDHLRANGILVAGGFSHPALTDRIRVTVGKPDTMRRFLNVFLPYLGVGR
ncbi:histidinol-phosphate transaminase [Fundidesulfovibrio butyratiphilus]